MSKPLNWTPAGPIANAYEHARDRFAVIIGPDGSGKTTASARRCIRAATWQPVDDEGVRYARVLVIGPTTRALRDQVLPSFLQAVEGIDFNRTTSSDGDVDLFFGLDDGDGAVALHVMFRGLNGVDPDHFFMGLELTGVWAPNLDWYKDDAVVRAALRRVGRYPGLAVTKRPSGDSFGGVWGDCPDYRVPAWLADLPTQQYAQPPGYDPASSDGFSASAENVEALRAACPDFYRRLNAVRA